MKGEIWFIPHQIAGRIVPVPLLRELALLYRRGIAALDRGV